MTRLPRRQPGFGAALALFAVALFTLLAGALLDVWRLQETRTWAHEVAGAAALRATARARDYSSYAATGQIHLDATAAQEAAAAVASAAARRGLTTATGPCDPAQAASRPPTEVCVAIAVRPTGTEPADPAYPPLGRARLAAGSWSPPFPAVGVYLEVPVETAFFGLVTQGTTHLRVHAFSAAVLCDGGPCP